MRNDQQAGGSPGTVKYCAICGRLISPHVRNFADRKYCSKTCSSTRLTEIDDQLESTFVQLAVENGSVECGVVQQIVGQRLGRYSLSPADDASQQEKTRLGNEEATFRERVRRAARRVVVNGKDGMIFVCWSKGQASEPSFAKGEWAVKHVKS